MTISAEPGENLRTEKKPSSRVVRYLRENMDILRETAMNTEPDSLLAVVREDALVSAYIAHDGRRIFASLGADGHEYEFIRIFSNRVEGLHILAHEYRELVLEIVEILNTHPSAIAR